MSASPRSPMLSPASTTTIGVPDQPAVDVSGVSVARPDGGRILDGVDMVLRNGRVYALTGPSGAGKTTLLTTLLGYLGPGLRLAGGRVEVMGRNPFRRRDARRLRGRVIGYMPQDPVAALDPRRRVGAQLATAAAVTHPDEGRRERRRMVLEAATTASFDRELLDRRSGRLSGGQAQRALLAWVLLARPQVVLLDEPTSGLDIDTARRVVTAMVSLPWRPAVLAVTHDLDLIADYGGARLDLVDGRVRPVEIDPGSTDPASIDDGASPAAGNQESPRPRTRPNLRVVTAPLADPGPSPTPALSADDVTIVRGRTTVLRSESLQLAAGELVALCGQSGSGKTSLARALSGFTPPTSGHLFVHGAPVPWEAGVRARGHHPYIAYVGQDARVSLHPHETIDRSLARAVASADRRSSPGAGDRPGRDGPSPVELLGRFGLSAEVLDRTPDRLSGGQRHRVLLARAMAAAPAVLVCDETTAALDPSTVTRVLDALETLRAATGLAVLFVTHQHAVTSRSDRVLTLEEGQLR
ncbi:MAG: ABC transporter ATP-binding protein [Acidimicrobiales bacterium]